jgi:hypothetical protein
MKCANFLPLEVGLFSYRLENSLYILLYQNPLSKTRPLAQMSAHKEGRTFNVRGLGKEIGGLYVG